MRMTTEGRSIDRSLVQVKHSRSSIDVRCRIAVATKTMAQTCAGWFVELPVTCGIGARGTSHPTLDRRPDEAGLSARFANCGRPGAEPVATSAAA
jgi:hypothetical protein